MNCTEAKSRLIDSLYGELADRHGRPLQDHLAGCDSCRGELEALRQGHRRLGLLEGPQPPFDFSRLYRTAAQRGRRSRRRWRRLAMAACAAALLVMALAAGGLRIDWRPGEMVVSFDGKRPVAEPVGLQPAGPQPGGPSPAALGRQEDRIEALEEVVRLLYKEIGAGDVRHAAARAELRRQLARFQGDIGALARQTNVRWRLTERDIRDLYLTQFTPDSNQEGAIP